MKKITMAMVPTKSFLEKESFIMKEMEENSRSAIYRRFVTDKYISMTKYSKKVSKKEQLKVGGGDNTSLNDKIGMCVQLKDGVYDQYSMQCNFTDVDHLGREKDQTISITSLTEDYFNDRKVS